MSQKLHEVIALVQHRKGEAQRKLSDLHQTSQKAPLYGGMHRTYSSLVEAQPGEAAEHFPDERQEIQLRVGTVLDSLEATLTNVYDLVATQDTGNQTAKGDVVVNGDKLLSDVPVSTLIYLEKQLDDLKKFYSSLPILDPAKPWIYDPDGECHKVTSESIRAVRKKIPLTLHPATDKHPAQCTLIEEDRNVGRWTKTESSGALTAKERSDLLERVSLLRDAVVTARERANQVDVTVKRIGKAIFNFLHEGV